MATSELCTHIEQALAEDLQAALPAELAEHSKSCPSCATLCKESHALAQRMRSLAEHQHEQAAQIDLSVALMEQLAEGRRARPWRRLSLAAAFCALLIALWQVREKPSPLLARVSATHGASLVTSRGRTEVQGVAIDQALPFSLSTQASQRAQVLLPRAKLELGVSSTLALRTRSTCQLERGSLELDARSAFSITPGSLPNTTLRMRGHAAIALASEDQAMKLLKRHKVLAASATLALVLYTGWATLTTSEGETRIDAPKGVYLDENGKAHPFDPSAQAGADDLMALANAASNGTGAGDGDDAGNQPSGAFWSEEEQVVKFRIRGESFDADTGQPLDGFELVATPLDSKDFAQRGPITRSFHELVNGEFVVEGMGLGTWKVSATREGYAPVIQTLEIADLHSSPYLVIPLSSSGAQLSGRVIDWRGRPVADATIGISDCAETKKKSCNVVTSDASGNFVLDKLPEEEVYSVYAKHDRYGFATSKNLHSIVGEEDSGQHITIQLSGVLRIYGQVFKGAEDQPVANAQVVGGGGETQTGASGEYELIVPLEENPEAHVVSYPGSAKGLAIHSYPDDRSVRPLEWVDAPTHAAQVRIDFHLEMSSATLVGQIRSVRGEPQAGLQVQLANTNGWIERSDQTFPTRATTDANGNYRVDHIPAGAGYMLRYRQEDKEPWNELGYVNIEDQSEVRADFQVGKAAIRGRFVQEASGEPIAVADSSCSRLGAERTDSKGVFALAHCYPDGRFEIVNLMPGSYQLHSKTEWMDATDTFKSKTVTVKEAQVLRDVEIQVEGQGAIIWRFRILSSSNEFLLGAYIRYQVGHASTTRSLSIGDDGVAEQQISASIDEIFLEVPGYEPSKLALKSLDHDKVQEVHMKRLEEK